MKAWGAHRSVRFFAAACAAALLLAAGSTRAATNEAGSNAGEFLRLGFGARGPAMGDAFTAAAEGATALHYNPAAVAWTDRSEVEAMYQSLVLDVGQGTLGFARPWGERSAWGISVSYLDYGTTQRTTIATAGGVVSGASAGSFGGSDLAVGLTYGRRIDDWAWGATAKVISSSIDDASAAAFAADIGLSWRHRSSPLRIGVTAQNIGTELTFDRANEHLPLLLRGGVTYSFFDEDLRLHADVEKVRDEDPHFMAGAEYWVADLLALRVGYDGRFDIDDGLTAGAGIRYEDLAVDYAYIPYGKAGANHRVGLRYLFGEIRPLEPRESLAPRSRAAHAASAPRAPAPSPAPPRTSSMSGGTPREWIDW